MSDLPGVPATAITAGRRAARKAARGSYTWDSVADEVLAAAAPHIDAAARADERRRICQLVIEKGAVYRTGSRTQRHLAPFADLLAPRHVQLEDRHGT